MRPGRGRPAGHDRPRAAAPGRGAARRDAARGRRGHPVPARRSAARRGARPRGAAPRWRCCPRRSGRRSGCARRSRWRGRAPREARGRLAALRRGDRRRRRGPGPLGGRPAWPGRTTSPCSTTCALDYRTWADHFPAGESRDGDVRVLRFGVPRPRDGGALRPLLQAPVGPAPRRRGRGALDAGAGAVLAGPARAPRAVRAAATTRSCSCPTSTPRPTTACRWWPTARCSSRRCTTSPRPGCGSWTARSPSPAGWPSAPPRRRPSAAPGSAPRGARRAWSASASSARRRPPRPPAGEPFVLYLGRVDPSKGCDVLLDHHRRAMAEDPSRAPAGAGRTAGHGGAALPVAHRARLRERRGEGPAAGRGRRRGAALAVREPVDLRPRGVDARHARPSSPSAPRCWWARSGGAAGACGTRRPRSTPRAWTGSARSPSLAAGLGRQGRRYARSRYDPDRVGERLEDLVAAVAAR